jgi:Cu+-exporting ATPase
VGLLVSIGYEPRLTLGELDRPQPDSASRRQWLQIGIAGFAFGNVMLFSLPVYFGLDSLSGPAFRLLFGCLSLALALPVLAFSAADYWRSALLALRQRVLTLEVPIALGLAALFAQSAAEILTGRGPGYLDSLTGLVFFLLCGRVFQQATHDRLAFDRDYKCFFPLAVVRKTPGGEEPAALADLRVGDRVVVRHGELVPADATLVSGPALIDYSFVTGESEPGERAPGAHLYAGGRQMGGAIELELVKPVSQSYLASLWDHEAFRKTEDTLHTLTNRYSRRFTAVVIVVAMAAAGFWLVAGDAGLAAKAFISVLIVACPCALALAAPFTLGTAQRLLARSHIFLRNALVLERLAGLDTLVFDKTGTLTASQATAVAFHCAEAPDGSGRGGTTADQASTDGSLTADEEGWIYSLTRHSTHPHARRINAWYAGRQFPEAQVRSFRETSGGGLEGEFSGHSIWLGSPRWLARRGVTLNDAGQSEGSVVGLAIDGIWRGAFVLANPVRSAADQLLWRLGRRYELFLLSGDHERERARFRQLFGTDARLHFNQSPLDKLGFIRDLQQAGRSVGMIGDGLNDAGALKQSDVGVAVVEQVGAFSPASDVILEADQVPHLAAILALARQATGIVRVSFGISALYNVLGISIAAAGLLSPVFCAVLMPLSSATVVLFACGATTWAARRAGVPG